MKINGIDDLTMEDLLTELENGGKFVVYTWTISILIMTFKNPSDIYFIRGGHSRSSKGLPFTLASMLLGWWGIPWGPIHTIGSIFGNLGGGKDVTRDVVNSLDPAIRGAARTATGRHGARPRPRRAARSA